MISFKKFVDAIHDAVLAANDSLMDKNEGILKKFFVQEGNDSNDLQNKLDAALKATKATGKKETNVTRDDYLKVSEALKDASDALSGGNPDSFNAAIPGKLKPRMVTVEYPNQTENGIQYLDVEVPLITLSPITMSHIEKATLKANFEMEIIDDELIINFTNREHSAFGKRNKSTRGQLEITISPTESPEGLLQLIEGYEKVLKSQIPS